jgi:hypothetical protein
LVASLPLVLLVDHLDRVSDTTLRACEDHIILPFFYSLDASKYLLVAQRVVEFHMLFNPWAEFYALVPLTLQEAYEAYEHIWKSCAALIDANQRHALGGEIEAFRQTLAHIFDWPTQLNKPTELRSFPCEDVIRNLPADAIQTLPHVLRDQLTANPFANLRLLLHALCRRAAVPGFHGSGIEWVLAQYLDRCGLDWAIWQDVLKRIQEVAAAHENSMPANVLDREIPIEYLKPLFANGLLIINSSSNGYGIELEPLLYDLLGRLKLTSG